MPLTIKTAPVDEPLTTADAKAHLRVDHDDENAVIDEYVKAARSAVEAFLKGPLLPTVFRYTLDGFPAEICLPVGPVLAAAEVAIAYVDTAGASRTLATDDYQVSTGEKTRIRPAYSKTWPTTRPQFDAVTVTFTAGHAAAADIPPAVMGALRMTLGHFYEEREVGEMPLGARNLAMPFVRWS